MTIPESLTFESTFISIPVTYAGKGYYLKEADSETIRKFKRESAKSTEMEKGGVKGVSDPGRLELYLVSLCLFDGETDNPVSLEELSSWRASVVSEIFEVAAKVNGLKEKEETDDEEDPSGN